MKFPSRENDVVRLAETIITGLTEHAGDFPSLEPEPLQAVLTVYKQKRDSFTEAQALTKTTVVQKDDEMTNLVDFMKTVLKRAEADVASDPEKLAEIGWGPRQEPQPIQVPASPTELHPIAEGQGSIWLKWEKPASDGGPVRSYIVERHDQQAQGGNFGEWTCVGTSYNCEINLLEQPTDVRVEYRVKAANAAGESMSSNTVSVVLP